MNVDPEVFLKILTDQAAFNATSAANDDAKMAMLTEIKQDVGVVKSDTQSLRQSCDTHRDLMAGRGTQSGPVKFVTLLLKKENYKALCVLAAILISMFLTVISAILLVIGTGWYTFDKLEVSLPGGGVIVTSQNTAATPAIPATATSPAVAAVPASSSTTTTMPTTAESSK